MTDAEWNVGIEALQAMLPDPNTDPATVAIRGRLFRGFLDDLTGEQWRHAVAEAIRRGAWFRTVARLRTCADEYRAPVLAMLGLPPSRLSPEELESLRAERRNEAARGLELCREAFERVTGEQAPAVVKDMPRVTAESEAKA